MRQEPETFTATGNGELWRQWSAWGICSADGTMAEVTLDPAKAAVWKRGKHKVIGFVHQEPVDGRRSNPDAPDGERELPSRPWEPSRV